MHLPILNIFYVTVILAEVVPERATFEALELRARD
jgi:hypothetical protein